MTNHPSRSGCRARRAPGQPVRALAAVLVVAIACGGGLAAPAGATDEATPATSEERVLGREAIIGKLVPITGDPLEIRSLDLRVEFRINSADLTEGAAAQLRELGAALISEALRGAAVGVYGHTDTSGRAQYNQALSEGRAQAVAEFLREHFAIAGTRFREVRGYGEERLRDDLPPDAPAQRRVEIVTFHEVVNEGAGDQAVDAPASAESGNQQGSTPSPASDGVTIPGAGGTAEGAHQKRREDGEGSGGYIAIQ